MASAKRADVAHERAFLIGVELRAVRRTMLKNARLSREAARVRLRELEEVDAEENTSVEGEELPADFVPDLSAEESLEEFHELATSAGATIVGEFIQRRDKPDPATLIGRGKLEEIAAAAASSQADVILFDQDLTPSQQRNIEREVKVRVIDRTQLILDIFARHARTREGQLQVELAQLEYMLPRLAGRGVEMSQLGGGIGTRGPGETQLETDRRKIYRRIRHVKEQLEEVRRIRAQQRQRREAVPVATVALVGYTNAGKSTLFNALTNAGVLSSARMFATLDPTIRGVQLPSKRKILLSDTVGFIRNLPHTLVTSFRATLEEVQRAALILHVEDAASPQAREQRAQVEKVLEELEVRGKKRLYVKNKLDLLPAAERPATEPADEISVSALSGENLQRLLDRIDALLTDDAIVSLRLKVPQSEGKTLAFLEANARIVSRTFRTGSVHLKVQIAESLARQVRPFVIE